MNPYRHILLATDFSAESDPIGARAVELARHYQARLSLVHVVEYIPVELGYELVLPEQIDVGQHLVEEGRKRLGALAERLGVPEAAQWVEQDSAHHGILRLAQERGVDLIVLGSHGRRGLARLLGSTANAVLHGADCDVLAVRVQG